MTQGQFKLTGTLAVIGGGRMGEAIIKGLTQAGAISPESVLVAEPVQERRTFLVTEYGVECLDSASEAAARADLVVIAVKPQVIAEVVTGMASSVQEAVVVSIAAGITCTALEALLPPGTSVVRVMPNTPAMVGEGMSVISAGSLASPEEVEMVRNVFALLGEAVILAEEFQDAATAISGSGPAYVAIFLDALAQGGEAQGLPREVAHRLATQTMRGTVDLLDQSGMSPEELVRGVSSPGGTTVAATTALDEGGFRETITSAVDAAVKRAKELGS